MLWEVDIYPARRANRTARRRRVARGRGRTWHLPRDLQVVAAHGYLIETASFARRRSSDAAARAVGRPRGRNDGRGAGRRPGAFRLPPAAARTLVHVLPKPGVMDPVAQSALAAIADFGVAGRSGAHAAKVLDRRLSDDAAATALRARCWPTTRSSRSIVGPLPFERLELGSRVSISSSSPCRCASWTTTALLKLSREGQLYLSLAEMQTIQAHFRELGRDPTDVELETIAQTWSEHCSHKTLAGRIAYRDEHGERRFENMLKETIFAATQKIRQQLGDDDWCVSVFKDNAGVVRFDDAVQRRASRSKRTTIPRPWSLTAARTPASAA